MEPKILNSYRVLISEGKKFSKIVNRIDHYNNDEETPTRLEVITRIIDTHRHTVIKKFVVSGQVNQVVVRFEKLVLSIFFDYLLQQSMETFCNLNETELRFFERDWKRNWNVGLSEVERQVPNV
jgi:hypothetical protein